MNIKYLTKYAERFLEDSYSLSLDIPIVINNRIKNCMGAFIYTNKKGAIKIELSGYMIKYGTENTVLDTLKHELVHYALYSLNKPCKDGQEYFENELKRLSISETRSVTIGKFMEYICPKCQRDSVTETKKMMVNPHLYRTRCCNEPIKPTKFIICNGEEELEFPYAQ